MTMPVIAPEKGSTVGTNLRQRAERARDHGGGVTLDAETLMALLEVAEAVDVYIRAGSLSSPGIEAALDGLREVAGDPARQRTNQCRLGDA